MPRRWKSKLNCHVLITYHCFYFVYLFATFCKTPFLLSFDLISGTSTNLYFRLEKEYTTIKSKEMEEQVEIKVMTDSWVRWTTIPKCQPSSFSDFAIPCCAEAADREPAPEAEDRHTRESECLFQIVVSKPNPTLLRAHQHYINPSSCVRTYIMHLLLMAQSCLSLIWLLKLKVVRDQPLLTGMVNLNKQKLDFVPQVVLVSWRLSVWLK